MKMPGVVALFAVLVASACGGTAGQGSTHPQGSDGAGQASRDALVYAAVIRQLVTEDHGFGGAPSPYRRVYVLDGAVPSAADPMRLLDQPAQPFADGLDQQVIAELDGLPPVSFVASRRLAITGAEPGHVVHRGVLITLGPITWVDAQTAKVANNRWASGLNGQWLTYTVSYESSSWRVTGVAGDTVAIS